MRQYMMFAVAVLGLAGAAQAQQVEYVTRGSTGGHAIRFGSNPIRATLPRAYVRVNNSAHAIRTDARPNRVPVNVRYIKVHNSNHVIPTVALDQPIKRADRQGREPAQPTAKPKAERPAPSRHDLMIHALMRNKLECHR